MNKHHSVDRFIRTIFVTTAVTALLALPGAALASGTAQHEVSRAEGAKATMELVAVRTNGPAEVTTGTVSIAPGGHTPWHSHPGPHIVAVKSGTVRIYETDCTSKTYTAGQGFYDPGPTNPAHIHTAHNPETTGEAVLAITDIREHDKRLTINADPQPTASCFSSAAGGTGALGVTRTEDTKATVADPIMIATKGPAEAVMGHVSIGPGGHTAWHYHPGPHIVAVKSGTVRVYETDCTSKTYTAGQGFYDPGPTNPAHIHTAHNPETTGDAVLAITDIRDEDKRLTVAADPQPAASCFTAAGGGAPASGQVPATAVEATGTESNTLPRTGVSGRTGLLGAVGVGLLGVGATGRALARRRSSGPE